MSIEFHEFKVKRDDTAWQTITRAVMGKARVINVSLTKDGSQWKVNYLTDGTLVSDTITVNLAAAGKNVPDGSDLDAVQSRIINVVDTRDHTMFNYLALRPASEVDEPSFNKLVEAYLKE